MKSDEETTQLLHSQIKSKAIKTGIWKYFFFQSTYF